MKRDLSIYIQDILENMTRSEDFLEKMTFKEFVKDEKTHFAVTRCLEIIGEASKQVPLAVRRKYPEIPWRSMAGMRDIIAHEYFGIDLEKVWVAVKSEFSAIKPILKKIYRDLQT